MMNANVDPPMTFCVPPDSNPANQLTRAGSAHTKTPLFEPAVPPSWCERLESLRGHGFPELTLRATTGNCILYLSEFVATYPGAVGRNTAGAASRFSQVGVSQEKRVYPAASPVTVAPPTIFTFSKI